MTGPRDRTFVFNFVYTAFKEELIMKCENCGKNEVNFIYRSSINGRTEERHLCSECAEKLGYTNAVAAHSRRMMQSFFGGGLMDDLFSPQPFLRPFFGEDLFDDFFQQMPALGTGTVEQAQPVQEKPLVEEKEQSRFARMRQLNALKLEQKAAVLREDFEKAAQIRDQIRELEQEKKSGSAGQDRPRSE